MGVAFDYDTAADGLDGATHFSGGNECSHQKENGAHYHIEIEREMTSKGLGYADVAVVLTLDQARELRDDLSVFLNGIVRPRK